MKQAHVIISGQVQGVGYRFFVKLNAEKLGLNGWVHNTSNGNVEAVFQGSQKKIEEMLSLCRKGPPAADVTQVRFEWEENEDKFDGFEIRK